MNIIEKIKDKLKRKEIISYYSVFFEEVFIIVVFLIILSIISFFISDKA